jgi:O-acetyl-ADP-ribose deacetylase (regulator of RNase III)
VIIMFYTLLLPLPKAKRKHNTGFCKNIAFPNTSTRVSISKDPEF